MAAVILSTVLQVLDTTIANVALPHMQASLGATQETITWALTSYIVATAVATPIAGWLAEKMGLKRLFLISVGGFVLFSMACGAAQNLGAMVLFRGMQGIFGAFLMPLGQTVILNVYPPEQHGKAMASWGAAVMISPIMGPVLGGWLTENFSWRWVFFINVPIGLLAFAGLWLGLNKRVVTKVRDFDLFGFAMLSIALIAMQLMFDRGQQRDWFESTEIVLEAGIAIAALWVFGVHLATGKVRLFPPAMLADRNFLTGMALAFMLGVMTIAGAALLPPMLQQLYGYPVVTAGLLMAPRAAGTMAAVIMVGRLSGKVDPRLLIFGGVCMVSLSLWQMTGFTLDMDQRPIIISGLIQGFGFGLIFIPVNLVAFTTLPAQYRTDAAAMFNLLRNLGGSIGVSVATAMLARSVQINHAEIGERMTNPMLALPQQVLQLGNRVLHIADAEVNRQALMIGYLNDYYLMMLLMLAALPMLLLLRKARQAGPPDPAHAVME
jgi:DHA2 family multidrug resistance protein